MVTKSLKYSAFAIMEQVVANQLLSTRPYSGSFAPLGVELLETMLVQSAEGGERT
jgi:hypothetical protein